MASRPSIEISRGDSPQTAANKERRTSLLRKRAATDIITKSWEGHTESESMPNLLLGRNGGASEDSVSVSSIASSEGSTDVTGGQRRKIKSFKTLAWIVRAWISLLPRSYFESEVIYEEVNGENLLKAGTTEAIVKNLTPEESSDAKHLREFLLTYRYYSTPTEILELLFERFRKNLIPTAPGQPAIIPLRVINIIRRWLKEFFYDLEDDDASLTLIEQFLDVDVAKADTSLSRWVDQIKKIIKEQTAAKAFPAPSGGLKRAVSLPPGAFPNNGLMTYEEDDSHDGHTKTEFTNINPVDIFRQLTIFEVQYFKSITPKDMFMKTSKKQMDKCPNLMRLITQFNNTSFWVAKEICSCQDLKHRTIILKRFIHIAELCYEWKNFNTCLEIVGGLSMTCVQRLKKTWKNLPSKYDPMWKNLQKLMAPTQNYIAYRNYFKTAEDSAFPYFGLFLSDLSVIQEKYPTRIAGGKINFAKMRMLAGVLIDMQKYQSLLSYPFGDNPIVARFLEDSSSTITDEEELYALSKQCEGSEDLTISSRTTKFSLKSPRHKTRDENLSIEKFDFSPPRPSQS